MRKRRKMECRHLEILRTERLTVLRADSSRADLFFTLWTNPAVMRNVGFPSGIPVTRDEITLRLRLQPDSDFDRLSVVLITDTGEEIGECCLHKPDKNGVARTDVKLLPEFWGRGYGVEIKRAMLDYLFTNTDCVAVEASPNIENTASIRMQEAVGGVKSGEGVYRFPDEMKGYTVPVHHLIYTVTREKWAGL